MRGMTDYKKLAIYYLKASKRRSMITIIGVAITVIVLYAGLNLAYSFFLNGREEVRKEADYEIVFLTEDNEKLAQIAADDRIIRAYTGSYETMEPDGNGDWIDVFYKNALYTVTDHPYQMESIMEDMMAEYDVNAEINWELSAYYFQDSDNGLPALVIFILLIAYIFAIFAVGIIRNTIQMFTLEQVKDYGILRCVGSTKKQLKAIIYLMGAILEGAGIGIGVLIGVVVSVIIGFTKDINAGFHVLPMIPILIAYFGDLYFVMNENCKLVTKMTPISAVRGEYRIKKEKFKRRGKGLMGLVFGIEGEYARKSVLRNKGRFLKTIAAMIISITAVIAGLSCLKMISGTIDNVNDMYGDYPLAYTSLPSIRTDAEEAVSYLPSAEEMVGMADSRYILEAKKVYACMTELVDPVEFIGKMTEDYKNQTIDGLHYSTYMENLDEKEFEDSAEDPEAISSMAKTICSEITVTGSDEADLNYLSKYLKEGTTELSENGILVAVGGSIQDYFIDDETVTLYDMARHYDAYNFQLGETMDVVNFDLYSKRCQEAFDKLEEESEDGLEEDDYSSSTMKEEFKIQQRIKEELIKEGEYTTYVVEGILDFGDELLPVQSIYMNRDAYFELTGFTEDQISGVQYKIDTDKAPVSFYQSLIMWDMSGYAESMIGLQSIKRVIRYVLAAVIFVFSLSSVNIINTTAGSLHLRRKEFAQLRVIGMSRKRLIRTVMLEGVMTMLISNVIGFALGTGLTFAAYSYINLLIPVKRTIAWGTFLAAFVVSGLIICGSIYMTIRELPAAMVDDLKIEE